MRIRLRGHHLVCLRFYDGQGFPEAYRENLRAALLAAQEEGLIVVEGADDVCLPCPSMKDGRCVHGPGWEEEIRAMDRAAMALIGVRPGDVTSWDKLGRAVRGIFERWQREFCTSCQWRAACEGNDDYAWLLDKRGSRAWRQG